MHTQNPNANGQRHPSDPPTDEVNLAGPRATGPPLGPDSDSAPARPASASSSAATRTAATPRTTAPGPAAAHTPSTDAHHHRFIELDVLRAIALMGILLVNMPPVLRMTGIVQGNVLPIRHGLDLLVQQRFFPIFSLLFGLGFGIFLYRAAHRTTPPRVALTRRFLALGVLGAVHQFFQPGEALLPYALIGLVVLLPLSWLPWWLNLPAAAALLATALALTSGGVSLVPAMLALGLALAQLGPANVLRVRTRYLVVCCALASTLAVPALLWQEQHPLSAGFTTASAVAGLCLAAGYVTGVLLVLRTVAGRVLAPALEPLGRMALTNYVTATALFLPLGHLLGLYDQEHWARALVLAGAISALQFGWSHLWLERFRYGPLEWCWRCVTWWRFVPLRRSTGSSCTSTKSGINDVHPVSTAEWQ